MTNFPDASAELTSLRRILDAGTANASGMDGALRSMALELHGRLSGPIRVAVAGRPGSRKAALTQFLVSHEFEGWTAGSRQELPLYVSYGETPSTVAGWDDGKTLLADGVDVLAAVRASPDYVEVRLPDAILRDIGFLDVPSPIDLEVHRQRLEWAAARSEVFVWCTAADHAWDADDKAQWAAIPKALHRRSLLVATRSELATATEHDAELREYLRATVQTAFRDVCVIVPDAAIAAVPDGLVADADALSQGGGSAVAARVMALSVAARKDQIAAAQVLIAGAPPGFLAEARPAPPEATPAQVPAPQPEMPAATPPEPPAAAPPEPIDDIPAATVSDPREMMRDRLDDLIARAAKKGGPGVAEVPKLLADLIHDLGQTLGTSQLVGGPEHWLGPELGAASNRLEVLQGKGDKVAAGKEAAAIARQISRDLSTIAVAGVEA